MILQALNGYYERLSSQGGEDKIAPPGFSYQGISFVVVLGDGGRIVDIDDMRDTAGRNPQPLSMLVPQPPKRSGKKPPPAFLWDKTGYVFGIERDGEELVENTAYQDAFRAYHHELLDAKSDDAGLKALLAFVDTWDRSNYPELRYAKEMAGSNVAFRLDGDRAYIHERPAAQQIWAGHKAPKADDAGLCLVTGEVLPIARLHASIKGVDGAQSSGASIVSFNQESFASYGKEQGENAPVSERAAFAYTTALNHLLSASHGRNEKGRPNYTNRVQIGDATTVFWAEASDAEVAQAAEQAFHWILAPPTLEQNDASKTKTLRDVMERVEQGRPLADPELKLDPGTRFYVLGLSPNAARISIRFFHATTLGEIGEAFHQHWNDLRIETPPPRGLPPSIPALALRTAPGRRDRQKKLKYSFDDVSPLLSGEIMRAILSKGRYPASLLSNLVMRIRTDGEMDRIRVTLIKAIIVRAMRLEGHLPKEDYLVRSDPNDPNPARRLGRLFAILERAQTSALGDKVNATIKDKYLGAAAATPARVFPGLIMNAAHHTARLRKGHTDASWVKKPKAAGFALDRDIGLLTAGLVSGFPKQQSIEDQGLFLVGYYQERFGGRPDQDVGEEPGVDATDDNDISAHDEE